MALSESSRRRGESSTRRIAHGQTSWEQKNHALDLAYDAYCSLRAAGHSVTVDEFVAHYPTYHKSLRRLIDLHEAVDEMVDFAATAWPQVGDRRLGFDIVQELGSGGMARVYVAREPALGNRQVVVKYSIGGGYEAELLGKLSHPNIVPVFSVRCDEATAMTAVCMPYLGSSTLTDVLEVLFGRGTPPTSGRDILDALRQREWSPEYYAESRLEFPPSRILQRGSYGEAVVQMGVQIAEALAYTAQRGIVHRDLKPSNVLVTPSGRPRLLDFNLSVDSQQDINRLGGTLPYMPPEQINEVFFDPYAGIHSDPRSDLFSLGVILYEMLTGELPFVVPEDPDPRTNATAYLERQRQGPARISRLVPLVGPSTVRAIESCLAFDVEQRPGSPQALVESLGRFLAPARRLRRAAVRHRRDVIFFGIGACSAASVAAGLFFTRAERLFAQGLEHLEQGRHDAAVPALSDSLAIKSDSMPVRFARGIAYLCSGKYASAIGDLEHVWNEHKSETVCACRGYAYFMSKEFKKASANYLIGARMAEGPEKGRLLVSAAFCYHRSDDDMDDVNARRRVSQAIAADPRCQAAYHLRARLYISTSSRHLITAKQALDDIEQAFCLGDASWLLERDAAQIYTIVGDATGRDYSTKIKQHIKNAARKGALRRIRHMPGFKRWIDPNEFLRIRAEYEGDTYYGPGEVFVTPPSVQSIVDALRRGHI